MEWHAFGGPGTNTASICLQVQRFSRTAWPHHPIGAPPCWRMPDRAAMRFAGGDGIAGPMGPRGRDNAVPTAAAAAAARLGGAGRARRCHRKAEAEGRPPRTRFCCCGRRWTGGCCGSSRAVAMAAALYIPFQSIGAFPPLCRRNASRLRRSPPAGGAVVLPAAEACPRGPAAPSPSQDARTSRRRCRRQLQQWRQRDVRDQRAEQLLHA